MIKKIPPFIALTISFLLSAVQTSKALDLTVYVTNLRSAKGEIHFAIYDNPELFPMRSGKLSGTKVSAKLNEVTTIFKGLEPGTYAVAIYHDENENGKFDRGFLGIPIEGYAFSKDASVFLGPPSFNDASVILKDGATSITIKMDY